MAYVLGICSNVHMASAALCYDGDIVAAIAEERLTREKNSRKFPKNSIEYCLKEAGIKMNDISCVYIANDPGVPLNMYDYRYVDVLRWYPEIIYQIPMELAPFYKSEYIGPLEQKLNYDNCHLKVNYISHHLSHMANAFYLSPFKDAAILTVDGCGEDGTAIFGLGTNKEMMKIRTQIYPHSLGLFYGTITEFLGYRHDRDEWKVMGMSAYGHKNNEFYYKLRKLIEIKDDGTFELNLKYFNFYLEYSSSMYSDALVELIGCPPVANNKLEAVHFEIAAAIQQIIEEILTHMLEVLYKETKCSNVVLGGGVFMNSLFNGKLLKTTPFEDMFISSCPDDSGLAIGAALYGYYNNYNGVRLGKQIQNYYGPSFSMDDIERELRKAKLQIRKVEDIERYIAEKLADGKVVGWFQGRMELGQRALGNRSILADPRKEHMKDHVNSSIKFREKYRPFASSVIAEDFSLYFDEDYAEYTKFMSLALKVKDDKKKDIPAVIHEDGTTRVQAVKKEENFKLYKLLTEFKKITQIGVLLNTSFNIQNEPIVCNPQDAIRTFYSSGLDILVIENYVIEK